VLCDFELEETEVLFELEDDVEVLFDCDEELAALLEAEVDAAAEVDDAAAVLEAGADDAAEELEVEVADCTEVLLDTAMFRAILHQPVSSSRNNDARKLTTSGELQPRPRA
jgi:hypothetical protein